ncbi:MAG: pentapeptide repeat-containing protein [Candidatus Bathyarchaeia archaeon]
MVERFETEFLREVERQREAHPDYLDFTGFQFPTIVFFSINLPNIFFDNATFNMPCYFYVISGHSENIHFTYIIEEQSFLKPITFEGTAGFDGATFEGHAGFNGATFKGDAEFNKATFKGSAGFDGATFKGSAGFNGATFEGHARFNETTFKGHARFNEATFKESAGFNGTTFEGHAGFDGATFKGSAGFNGTTFEGHARFHGATFKGHARFHGATFEGHARFNEATFKGYAGFHGATFKGSAGFDGATFEGHAGFDGATFEGDAEFDEATFEGHARFNEATFKGHARFNEATFKGDARFNGATFKGDARFNGATFKESAGFHGATFEGHARFDGATFEGSAGFHGATFKGSAGFDGATFKGHAGFDGATFEGDAGFDGATFKGSAGFNGATFEGHARFNETTFEGDASFNTTNFNGLTTYKLISVHKVIDFTYTRISSLFNLEVNQWIKDNTDDSIQLSLIKIRRPSFSNGGRIIITGNMGKYEGNHLSGISFINSELINVEFLDDKWIRLNPSERKKSVDEILLDLKTKGRIEADDVSAANTAQLYRRLRDNYEETKRYEEAGDWFLGEMEIRRKHDPSPATRILHTIYYILAKYGESVLLPFVWSILTISMTTIYLTSSRSITSIDKMLTEALLDAFLMFLPFKTPDSYLSLFLHMVGALLLSLHYIALRRKLERR